MNTVNWDQEDRNIRQKYQEKHPRLSKELSLEVGSTLVNNSTPSQQAQILKVADTESWAL